LERISQERILPPKEYGMLNFIHKLYKDESGQDLIEYALMAGFVAVAAGAIMPGVSSNISSIFSKVGSVMANANGTGS
jgi:pilus assembly protein Flp/PilA